MPVVARKLQTLIDVGLGYIKLGQSATTLSGGEAQRVKLSLELSKRDTGRTLYILDEPTTGLHFADIELLLKVLQRLTEQGNTVVVIEHNLDVIKTADWLVDLGPEGGDGGRRDHRRRHAGRSGEESCQLYRVLPGAVVPAQSGQRTECAGVDCQSSHPNRESTMNRYLAEASKFIPAGEEFPIGPIAADVRLLAYAVRFIARPDAVRSYGVAVLSRFNFPHASFDRGESILTGVEHD